MKEGDIVLTSITQADGKTKLRPALVLREMPGRFNDILLCGISSQVHLKIEDFDELIVAADPHFQETGLLASSIIRLGFIADIPRDSIPGSIGRISEEMHRILLKRLCDYLVRSKVQS